MASNKDIYVKVLIELGNSYVGTQAGVISRVNKFNKFMLTTEDLQLREYISTYITLLKCHRTWEFNYRHSDGFKLTGNSIALAVKSLEGYLTSCINSQKPEWQIIAERHGWRAPNILY